ncbi:MAG: hypothetical protein ACE5J5_08385 [Candidatus Hydrothermarchaeales archaeon]
MPINYANQDKLRRAQAKLPKDVSEGKLLVEYLKLGGLAKRGAQIIPWESWKELSQDEEMLAELVKPLSKKEEKEEKEEEVKVEKAKKKIARKGK